MIVNIILDVLSCEVLLLIIVQFFTKKGSSVHKSIGKLVMGVGIVLVIAVAIRGLQQETMNLAYKIHLVMSFPFFYLLLETGFLGYQVRNNEQTHLTAVYGRYKKRTLISLILVMLAGIVAVTI